MELVNLLLFVATIMAGGATLSCIEEGDTCSFYVLGFIALVMLYFAITL